ncbi:MAG: hypothetical protein ACO1SX_02825 [Actinomycetota bacterium]
MNKERHQGETGASLERHYRRDTAMVFGPIFAMVGYAGVLLLAVAATPAEYRSWTIGVGVVLAMLAGFLYLGWAIRDARRRE